jgi:hypothetical protein
MIVLFLNHFYPTFHDLDHIKQIFLLPVNDGGPKARDGNLCDAGHGP